MFCLGLVSRGRSASLSKVVRRPGRPHFVQLNGLVFRGDPRLEFVSINSMVGGAGHDGVGQPFARRCCSSSPRRHWPQQCSARRRVTRAPSRDRCDGERAALRSALRPRRRRCPSALRTAPTKQRSSGPSERSPAVPGGGRRLEGREKMRLVYPPTLHATPPRLGEQLSKRALTPRVPRTARENTAR